MKILYEDNHLLVVVKPVNVPVCEDESKDEDLLNMIKKYLKEKYNKPGNVYLGLVHRLDRETSGVLVVAKNQRAAQFLANEFQNKTAHKEYLALLNGDVYPLSGVIDNYMVKGQVFDNAKRINDGTGQKPQRAITEYKVLSQAGGHLSWVLFSPKTGRTHQLRVHSALCLHAPIVGDILYGNNKKLDGALRSMLETNNLFLLAYRITFRHPSTGKMLTINAPIPDFMLPVIKFLEFKLP